MSLVAKNQNLWSAFTYPANRRENPRISLTIPIKIKGIDRSFFVREVKTFNVSRNGICIHFEEELDLNSMVGISAFNGKFKAAAKVCYVSPDANGGWKIGLKFIEMSGKWVVI